MEKKNIYIYINICRLGLGIVQTFSISIPIPWVRYRFLNDTFFDSNFMKSVFRIQNRSRGCQTLINLRRAASSRTHLVLQAYCLTDVDEINPLGIEIWYRTTRCFSILDGNSVPSPNVDYNIYELNYILTKLNKQTKSK